VEKFSPSFSYRILVNCNVFEPLDFPIKPVVNTFAGALALAALFAGLAANLGCGGAFDRLGAVGHKRVQFTFAGAETFAQGTGGVHAAHRTAGHFDNWIIHTFIVELIVP
jgi:hypothetical protein